MQLSNERSPMILTSRHRVSSNPILHHQTLSASSRSSYLFSPLSCPSMSQKNKFILVLILFFLIFGKSMSDGVISIFSLERYISSILTSSPSQSYNLALKYHNELSEEEKITIIKTLKNTDIWYKNPEKYELLWDLSITLSGWELDAIEYYRSSLSLSWSSRIQEKLTLLTMTGSTTSEMTPSWVSTPSPSPRPTSPETLSWAEMLQTAKNRLENDSRDRSTYLSPLSRDEKNQILRDTINFLDTNTERVDW